MKGGKRLFEISDVYLKMIWSVKIKDKEAESSIFQKFGYCI